MTKDPDRIDLPLSRLLAAAQVPPDGQDFVVTPTPAESAALAAANNLVAVPRFEARFRVVPFRGDGLEVVGEVSAQVRQTCVVTLEDFDAAVKEEVDVRFVPPRAAAPAPAPGGEKRNRRAAREIEEEEEAELFDASTEDPPDPLIDGAVDLGALAAEFFTLGLDPHPRKPDARFEPPAPAAAPDSPFAKLRALTVGSEPRDDES